MGRQIKRISELGTGEYHSVTVEVIPGNTDARGGGVRQEGKAADWGHRIKQVTNLGNSPWRTLGVSCRTCTSLLFHPSGEEAGFLNLSVPSSH